MNRYSPGAPTLKRDTIVHGFANKFINTFASDEYVDNLKIVYESGMVVYAALLGDPTAVNELEILYLEAKKNVQD